MNSDFATLSIRLVARIDAIPALVWNRCADADNPFVSHEFLKALEDSESVGSDSGWLPRHVVAETQAGDIVGVVPMYLKTHSFGEYVFDQSWADAYRRAGGQYYPKLQVAVPFSPVPGPRLLVAPDAPAHTAEALVSGLIQITTQLGVSSVHVTYVEQAQAELLEREGFLMRLGLQFHWSNNGYQSFDDFLAALSSRKRKAIRKERREVEQSGVVMRQLTGDDIRTEHWDAFFHFYLSTSDRKWGNPYLTRGFFDELGRVMGDRVVLMMAEHDGRLVAGALNLLGRDTLYGRNWGCVADYPFLHFETCYYQAVEFAIRHGLARVEAGAQGEHKLQRGYLPVPTYSAHWIREPRLRRPVAEYLLQETASVRSEIATLMQQSPFRQDEICG
jgi:predicted N-acyltransferase